jgi:ribosomal protein S18 acetylase RimI-like enzyme
MSDVDGIVREARPQDNAALMDLAARCAMEGDVSLCVDRRPDFFALSRLAGDSWLVGVLDGADGPVACVGVARREVYLHGKPANIAYIGDLKVHPAVRRRGLARILAAWAAEKAAQMTGPGGIGLCTTLAGNMAAEGVLCEVTGGGPAHVPARPRATIRSHSIQLLWARRPPASDLVVEPAGRADLADMAELWRQVAPSRQLAPVRALEWIDDAVGLAVSDYLVARRPDGSVAGFLGLWDQHGFKQMRVVAYSRRLATVRLAFNTAAPIARSPRLPAPGGELRYRTVVNVCVGPGDVATLRTLLFQAYGRLRGQGCSFFTIGLDTRDPLTTALRGLHAQHTDVTTFVDQIADRGTDLDLGLGPLHFEIATV